MHCSNCNISIRCKYCTQHFSNIWKCRCPIIPKDMVVVNKWVSDCPHDYVIMILPASKIQWVCLRSWFFVCELHCLPFNGVVCRSSGITCKKLVLVDIRPVAHPFHSVRVGSSNLLKGIVGASCRPTQTRRYWRHIRCAWPPWNCYQNQRLAQRFLRRKSHFQRPGLCCSG